jgi:hypothetical protein
MDQSIFDAVSNSVKVRPDSPSNGVLQDDDDDAHVLLPVNVGISEEQN